MYFNVPGKEKLHIWTRFGVTKTNQLRKSLVYVRDYKSNTQWMCEIIMLILSKDNEKSI